MMFCMKRVIEVQAYILPTVKFLPEVAQVVNSSHVKYFWNQTCRFLVIQNLSFKIIMSYKGTVLGLYMGGGGGGGNQMAILLNSLLF